MNNTYFFHNYFSGKFRWDVIENQKKIDQLPKKTSNKKRLVDPKKWKNIHTVKSDVITKALQTLNGIYVINLLLNFFNIRKYI